MSQAIGGLGSWSFLFIIQAIGAGKCARFCPFCLNIRQAPDKDKTNGLDNSLVPPDHLFAGFDDGHCLMWREI